MLLFNGKKIDFKKFPNGETLVNADFIKNRAPGANFLALKYEDDSDLIKLMFVKKYLMSQGVNPRLDIWYMPYSRQDRVEGNSVFTLKYIANFINELAFEHVSVMEPHSDVTLALLDRASSFFPTVCLASALRHSEFDKNKDYVLFPDAGAQKRYAKRLPFYKHLVGYKNRDFATGKIDSMQLIGSSDLQGAKVIIIDDLCSKGGTFILAASKLKEINAGDIYLVVPHCEDAIFDGQVLESDLIKHVFTTNSILTKTHDKISVAQV